MFSCLPFCLCLEHTTRENLRVVLPSFISSNFFSIETLFAYVLYEPFCQSDRFFSNFLCSVIQVGETSAMVHPTGKRSRPQTAVGHLLHGWLGLHLGTSRPIAQDQQVAGGKTGPKREIDTKASHIGII